ncbi:helix-turn-helix domain-containing protein [Streptomyces uncialis]|uniref:helix-turn-helix domain-containing protein n=1 Tax=Streptomyces uncialis TaxID=1048205 RepID=UPI0036554096
MEQHQSSPSGVLLREWRTRRRYSQLDLALLADISARHLSCLETGRARPSRTMLLRLSTALDIPLRERNTLLLAAGHAPAYRESGLDDTYMASVRSAIDTMLRAHEPFPAVVVDRWWNVVDANRATGVLMDGIPPHVLEPRPNVFRLTLHPDGLAPRLANRTEVRELFLERLRRQAVATGDGGLRALHEEVLGYPHPAGQDTDAPAAAVPGPIQVPLRIRSPLGELSMFGTLATFGAPADVTLSELAIELFYPLDDFTARTLRELSAAGEPRGSVSPDREV